MEKISNIVRGNARVASTDLKSSGPVRPGTPSFGRDVSDTGKANIKFGDTASRAAALHNELEAKRTSKDEVVSQMADSFFMTRIRRPDDKEAAVELPGGEAPQHEDLQTSSAQMEQEIVQPSGYTPRGSY